LLAAL